ncbi:MAG: putative transposase, partial [Gammaproteobacteria bacterium]
HRCHKKEFLLKFSRDRECWIRWLFEAKKRYGLCVLNYVVTSNHIHLLVKDTGEHVIAKSLQLIAGRTAQEYNQRKKRKGAYWEDRYHATIVASDEHFLKCLIYIDLNMVRTGVVKHPSLWPHGGYQEIQHPRKRYRIIDISSLQSFVNIDDLYILQQQHRQWIEDEINLDSTLRDANWTESLAVGNEAFVNHVQNLLGIKANHRVVKATGDKHVLREMSASYNTHFNAQKEDLSLNNSFLWEVY